ncbi:MAG TPA: LOG family protein [Croceibacterium sp.]|nr:LOG family protein [Croceibacterium sp.]
MDGPEKTNTADEDLEERKFYRAEQEAGFVESSPTDTPQTRHPAYRLAFRDTDFLLRDELRPIRFQLELLKPSMLLDEARVGSTLVMYGSARIPPPDAVETALEGAKDLPVDDRMVVERLAEKAKYYAEAYKLARLVSEQAIIENGMRQFVVCSGGGPSIMEAANRGASDAGAESIGLNIVLPHEQAPNPYVTPYLSFQFHYFALRKMHFLIRARAVAVFPGGFGTFDEMFELLTLIQTGKMKPIPVLLFGKEFWTRVIDFGALAREGVISPADLELITWCETADEAWQHLKDFYGITR